MAATAQMVHLTAFEMGRGPASDINRKATTATGSDMMNAEEFLCDAQSSWHQP